MFEGILQPMHLLLILVVALVVFGPKNLPAIGKGLGEVLAYRMLASQLTGHKSSDRR